MLKRILQTNGLLCLTCILFLVMLLCSLMAYAASPEGKVTNTWANIKASGKTTPGGSQALAAPQKEGDDEVQNLIDSINAQLAGLGIDARLGVVEWITDASSGQIGRTVYARDLGNKQLDFHWVPGDPRRGGGTDITWTVDMVDAASSVPIAQTEAAIRQAMDTWENVACSAIPLTEVGPYPGIDWGYVQWLLGYGGVLGWFADISHAGWLPGGFFDLLEPGGSSSIIGVTFTFVWVDSGDNPTDIDNNRKLDVALREIYYNDFFSWAIDANIDVETVALHEAGHGLSQAHFGTIFRTDANGKIHFSPLAVMNAAYSGVQQSLTSTDIGGHCSIWGHWPNQ